MRNGLDLFVLGGGVVLVTGVVLFLGLEKISSAMEKVFSLFSTHQSEG